MDTDLWKNIQYIATTWILCSLAAGDKFLNTLSGFYFDIIEMWGITIEVDQIIEPDTKTLTNETTEVIVHLAPDFKAEEKPSPTIKKSTLKVINKLQEDLDKITIDIESEDHTQTPPPIQEEFKGKEQLIKEIASKKHKSNCLPSSLIFIGVFFMLASVVVMAYWLTKN